MTRRWSLLTAVLIIGILAASWFLLVSPKRSDAATLRSQATKQQADNAALVQHLNELKAQSLDLPKQKAQLAVLGKQVPNNPALPTLIRNLVASGKKVGVDVVSMRPGTPAAVAIAVPAAAPVVAAATNPDGTVKDTTDAAATTTPTTPVVAAPVAAPLYFVPLSLEITGSYFEVEQFINKLEGQQRKFLLVGFTLKPADGAGSTATVPADTLDLTLSGQVFLSPNVAAAATTPVAAPAVAPAQ